MVMKPKEIIAMYEEAEARAKKTGFTRVHAGVYLAMVKGRLWKLSQTDMPGWSGWWIGACESDMDSYTDPYPTLRELKESLGVKP